MVSLKILAMGNLPGAETGRGILPAGRSRQVGGIPCEVAVPSGAI